MGLSGVEILTTYVVPSAGGILTLFLFFSPMQGALRVHREKCIGEFNIIPYAFMFANCFAWCSYAIGLPITSTFFVFVPNLLGFVSGAIVLALTFPYASEDTRFRVLLVFLGIICVQAPAEFFVATFTDTATRINIYGDMAIAVQLMFFASPLAGIVEIIRTKDSKSLYWPLALTASASSALWAVYGASIGAMPILAPNGVSTVIGLIQVVLCMIYKSSAAPHRVSVSENGEPNQRNRLKSKQVKLLQADSAEPSFSNTVGGGNLEAGMRPGEPSIYTSPTTRPGDPSIMEPPAESQKLASPRKSNIKQQLA
eukprot:TRINITY_DN546_c0_g1_i1.p1 TRINITY_DN546_c0_g1~~TRINITY_DN546_c0_g1_i1.p1  ORF type:complete len:312 (+),score=41.63 TRINITY_DN546_c0_g1_i1:87-1022(+)